MGNADGDLANWISGAALFVSLGVLLLGYLRRSPFVPASTAEELRQELVDQRQRNAELREENNRLRGTLRDALDRVEWWQEQYRRIRTRDDDDAG